MTPAASKAKNRTNTAEVSRKPGPTSADKPAKTDDKTAKTPNNRVKPAKTPKSGRRVIRTAGERLKAELSKPADAYTVKLLIQQASRLADRLERLDQLLSGHRDSWLDLKIGPTIVEVRVSNLLVEERQSIESLRKLIMGIHSQRANLPGGDSGDDDPLARI